MIKRTEHSNDKKFTIVSRKLAQDKGLSFQARGLLLYVLSKPSNWQIHDIDLRTEGGIGKKALAGIIQDLKERGYVRRSQTRKKDGTITYVTEILEEPIVCKSSAVAQKEPAVPCIPLPSTVKEPTAIDSTGAGAGSSVDLIDLKEKARSYKPVSFPEYTIADVEDPGVFLDSGIMGLMVDLHPGLPFGGYYRKWWLRRMASGGIGRPVRKKAPLADYTADIESFFQTCEELAVEKQNGSNGNGHKKTDDRPIWMASKK